MTPLRVRVFAAVIAIAMGAAACASSAVVASGERAPLPTPTPVPTPTPLPTSTPVPTPEPTPTPEPVTDVRPGRGQRSFTIFSGPNAENLAVVRSVDDPNARSWESQLEPYADFVSTTFGPFEVEAADLAWLSDAAFIEQLRVNAPELDAFPEPVADGIRRFDDVHRALGIATVEFDVLAVNRETTTVVPAVYDTTTHTILVRGAPSDDSVLRQVALVHEVVHAWQGPERIRELVGIGGNQIVAGALIEGEAELVTSRWLEAWEPANYAEYERLVAERNELGSGQPPVLIAEARIRYVLGRRLYEAAERTGTNIDTTATIDASALLQPAVWAGGQTAIGQSVPAPEIDGQPVSNVLTELTALTMFQMFASAMPVEDALLAARPITSSSTAAIAQGSNDQTCAAIEVRSHASASDLVAAALASWAERLPNERKVTPTALIADPTAPPVEATVEPSTENESAGPGETVPQVAQWFVTACDPGPGLVPEPFALADQAVVAAGLMIDGEAWALEANASPAHGRCRGLLVFGDQAVSAESSIAAVRSAIDSVDASACPSAN